MSADHMLRTSYRLRNGTDAHQEMQTNRLRDQSGTVQLLLYSPEPCAPAPVAIKRITKPVRNFSMENKRRIRLLTADNHARAAAAAAKGDAGNSPLISSPSHYADVTSRFYEDSKRSFPNQAPRFSYLRSRTKTDGESSVHSYPGGSLGSSDGTATPTCSSRPTSSVHLQSVFSSSGRSLAQCGEKRNFVRLNGETAKMPKPVQGNAEYVNRTESYLQKLDRLPKTLFGEVPAYLLKRQEDWKQATVDAEEAIEQAKLPAGCQLMDEDEKEVIIAELQKTKAEKELELFRLPVRNDTLRARDKRAEIEAALCKLEEHLELLSKPKVYVPIEVSRVPDMQSVVQPQQFRKSSRANPAANKSQIRF